MGDAHYFLMQCFYLSILNQPHFWINIERLRMIALFSLQPSHIPLARLGATQEFVERDFFFEL